MRTFHCDHCRNPVFFENTRCTNCGHELGVLPDYLRVTALQAVGNGLWRSLMPAAQDKRYRRCENGVQHEVCNWMVVAEEGEAFCVSCRLNAVIPNLSRPGFLDHWFRLERSKRRLLYSLIKLGLPLQSRQHNPDRGLAFSFLSAQDAAPGEPILTGHANGHITLNIDEADPARRERNRLDLNEKYRTLLGHFRHEIGHYYWDLLIRDSEFIDGFRALFGDERQDYGGALNQYYANGAPAHWQDRYISRYASAHPWEDWAESWAHYLHIVDTLETAGHFGLRVERKRADGRVDRADPSFDAYRINSFERIIDHWLPLTYALNSLNRSMGQQDLYPFVLSNAAIEKLKFIHKVMRSRQSFLEGYLANFDTQELERLARRGLSAGLDWLWGRVFR